MIRGQRSLATPLVFSSVISEWGAVGGVHCLPSGDIKLLEVRMERGKMKAKTEFWKQLSGVFKIFENEDKNQMPFSVFVVKIMKMDDRKQQAYQMGPDILVFFNWLIDCIFKNLFDCYCAWASQCTRLCALWELGRVLFACNLALLLQIGCFHNFKYLMTRFCANISALCWTCHGFGSISVAWKRLGDAVLMFPNRFLFRNRSAFRNCLCLFF